MNRPDLPRLDRRTAIKWMLGAAASLTVLNRPTFAAAGPAAAKPYGTDPALNRSYQPGDCWPLTFNDEQRRTAAALCAISSLSTQTGSGIEQK